MSDQLIFDCGLIVAKYGGCACNIWKDVRDAGTVIARLQELKGVSQKISNMFVRPWSTTTASASRAGTASTSPSTGTWPGCS